MGGIFKFLQFMLLVMALFTPPEGATGMNCFSCTPNGKSTDECTMGKNMKSFSSTCKADDDICVSTPDSNGNERKCGRKKDFPDIKHNSCGEQNGIDSCICNTNNCNSRMVTTTTGSVTSSTQSHIISDTMIQIMIISIGGIIIYGFDFTQ